MKEIQLTKGYISFVDDADFESLSKFKWHAHQGRRGKTFYAARSFRMNGKTEKVYMHHQIMGLKGIDHKNGNGLDNRRENLRPFAGGQNMMNREKLNGRGRFKGAFKNTKGQTYMAAIRINGKSQYLGCFNTDIEAARAYDAKAKELFGEFAKLNFPDQSAAKPPA